MRFDITTVAEPKVEREGEPSNIRMLAGLLTVPSECSASVPQGGAITPPALVIESQYSVPTVAVAALEASLGGAPSEGLPAEKSVSGTTTTLAIASTRQIANKGFNCAFVVVTEESAGSSIMTFPLVVQSGPGPGPPPTRVGVPTPPAPPAPAALSIAKERPLELKVSKSRRVKIKLTDKGGTATGPGSLRVEAPRGVLVKPERQKAPVLLPGQSWTLSVRVRLTAKAKKRSKISLTATAPGLRAERSFVVKRRGKRRSPGSGVGAKRR